jgi:hypothetical protein
MARMPSPTRETRALPNHSHGGRSLGSPDISGLPLITDHLGATDSVADAVLAEALVSPLESVLNSVSG